MEAVRLRIGAPHSLQMSTDGIEKAGDEAQLRNLGPTEKAVSRLRGQCCCRKAQERLERLILPAHGPLTCGNLNATRTDVPGRGWPLALLLERQRVEVQQFARFAQPVADPGRTRHADGISDQLPAEALSRDVLRGSGPIDRESLQSLRVPDVRSRYLAVRGEYRRGGGNAEGGSALQRWDRIDCPAETRVPLGPIKSVRRTVTIFCRGLDRSCLIGKQDVAWISVQRGDEIDAPAALRQSERARIDDPVRPSIAEGFQRRCDDVHRLATPQLQHEGHILE